MSELIINLTHDVDRVHKTFQYFTRDLLRGQFKNMKSLFSRENPYWGFEHIIEIEKAYNVRSTFFFLEESIKCNLISPKSWYLALGRYKFKDPAVSKTIKNLDAGGWEIGLHGSYNSFRSLKLLKNEKASLEKALNKKVIGIRQHHLNLDIPETWKLQKMAGFFYDATYGKNNFVGFLNDKFRAFINKESGMFIIPLSLMDASLFNLAKNISKAWEICKSLIETAERESAILSVLWHQRFFNEKEFPGYSKIYEMIIEECKNRNARFLTCGEIFEGNFNNQNSRF